MRGRKRSDPETGRVMKKGSSGLEIPQINPPSPGLAALCDDVQGRTQSRSPSESVLSPQITHRAQGTARVPSSNRQAPKRAA